MYIQEEMYTHVYICIHSFTHIHAYTHAHISTHTSSHICTQHTYTHRQAHTYISLAHTHIYTGAYTYTHTCTHKHYEPTPSAVTCWWNTSLLKAPGTRECSMSHPLLFASLQEHTVNCTRTPVLTSAVWTEVPATARGWTARASVHPGSQVSAPGARFQTHLVVSADVKQPQTLCKGEMQSRDVVKLPQWDLL